MLKGDEQLLTLTGRQFLKNESKHVSVLVQVVKVLK